ncbi:hypothetical protein SAMD00019534_063150 [Acytostelium subglobosum LB1]|uniref:hypothetical protein n=1 Tax=Acytostelium subglobosum LB1 TaxID=1410327 RepID=UPI00064506D3|nr:hypothetical protein SAMD00019534_063150 [Acytostelium subglobosum LB1]GAM23140.1 hypothetical protein SAMD00019534_063150 [Acytostelium subglobosum LB1]|eukprot:XP_012753589.1 hypothetical protein SAMD00019534_063150 [Acytostelium subglobosum LB1]
MYSSPILSTVTDESKHLGGGVGLMSQSMATGNNINNNNNNNNNNSGNRTNSRSAIGHQPHNVNVNVNGNAYDEDDKHQKYANSQPSAASLLSKLSGLLGDKSPTLTASTYTQQARIDGANMNMGGGGGGGVGGAVVDNNNVVLKNDVISIGDSQGNFDIYSTGNDEETARTELLQAHPTHTLMQEHQALLHEEKQQQLLQQQQQMHDQFTMSSQSAASNGFFQVMVCTVNMLLLYLLYGLLQEFIFKKQEVNFFNIYSFSQFFVSFLISVRSVLRQAADSIKPMTSPSLNPQQQQQPDAAASMRHFLKRLSFNKLRLYIILSLVLISTKILANESLRFINYKTRVMFQSSKLIPVMVIGGFMFKRSYSLVNYISVLAMTAGLVLFSIGDSSSSLTFSPMGLLIVMVYVFVESTKSILYEKILRDFSSEMELSLFTNFFSSIATLPIVFMSGEFQNSLVFFRDNINILILLIIFILLGYYANISFLYLMKISDSFYANVVSTFRKFITIIISFIFFKDTMLPYHVWGMLIFFTGVGLELKHSYTTKSAKSSKASLKESTQANISSSNNNYDTNSINKMV